MEDMQLNEILSSYRDAIEALIERIDLQDKAVQMLSDKYDSVDKLIYDEVLNPATEAMNQYKYDFGLKGFGERYKDKFEGYNDKLRPIEGQDFDIVKQAYDDYNNYEGEKPEEAAYVDELIKQVDIQLDNIRQAIGAPEDAEVTITDYGEGEPELKVEEPHDETEIVTEDISEEVPVEAEVIEISDGEDGESDPEELKKLEEELLAYK